MYLCKTGVLALYNKENLLHNLLHTTYIIFKLSKNM